MTDTSQPTVPYMERTKAYYRALGYQQDYAWAHFEDAPFARLGKPLAEARIGLATTTLLPSMVSTDKPNIGGKTVWSERVDALPDALHTDHISWDKESTHTRDRESYLPIETIGQLCDEGAVGELGPRVYGIPTVYSHRQTLKRDAPKLLELMVEDQLDAALLIPL